METEDQLQKIAEVSSAFGELIKIFEKDGVAPSETIAIVLQDISEWMLGEEFSRATNILDVLSEDDEFDGSDEFDGTIFEDTEETKHSQNILGQFKKIPESKDLLKYQEKISRLKTASRKQETLQKMLPLAWSVYEKYMSILESGGKKVNAMYLWMYEEPLKSLLKATTALQLQDEFERLLRHYKKFNNYLSSTDSDVLEDEIDEYKNNFELTLKIYDCIRQSVDYIQSDLTKTLGVSGHAVRYRVENSESWGVINRKKYKNSYLLSFVDDGF